jgi:hypothetical protein
LSTLPSVHVFDEAFFLVVVLLKGPRDWWVGGDGWWLVVVGSVQQSLMVVHDRVRDGFGHRSEDTSEGKQLSRS